MKRYLEFIKEELNLKPFVFEKMGYPDPIKEYFDIIYDICEDRIDKYLSRNGKFFNYNEKIDILYDEIKDRVSDENFIKFPVERIEIEFKINLDKESNKSLSYNSAFHKYQNKKFMESYWMRSKSGLVKKSINLLLTLQIEVGRNVNSIDINKMKKMMIDSINHELTHAYEFIYNNDKKPFCDIYVNFINTKLAKNSKQLNWFFYLIYVADKSELNANVTSSYNINSLNVLKNSDDYKIINYWNSFDPIDYFNKTIDQLKMYYTYKDIENFNLSFGEYFTDRYVEACKDIEYEPKKEIMKLKNKNMLEVFQYWDKIFKKSADYFKRKLSKNIIEQ